MNGTLRISLKYTTKDGERVLSYDTIVPATELDEMAAGRCHRDPINLRFELAEQELSDATEGFQK